MAVNAKVDSKCMAALEKVGMAKCAQQIADTASVAGAAEGAFTMSFLRDSDESDGEWVATLTVTVKYVV
jgi:hypothetical protein